MRAGQINPVGMGNRAGSYAACMAAVLLVAACNDAKVCQNCTEAGGGEPCPSAPILTALAGDSEVTLTWEPAVGLGATVKAWQIRQAVQEKSWSATGRTGAAATVYVVSGLKNDLAYTFQVRTQFDAADFGCWSAPISVVPRRIDDLMKEIEKHQRAISDRMTEVVKSMADGRQLLKELSKAEKEILQAISTSTSKIEEDSGTIRTDVGQIKTTVAEGRREIVDKLSKIVEKLGNVCDGCEGLPANCQPIGSAFFGHDSEGIEKVKWEKEGLPDIRTGLFLNVGHATSVGHAVHNLRLSDLRAACVSRCLDDALEERNGGFERGEFVFMEVASGEVLDMSDAEGTSAESEKNRRVDVTFCPDYPNPGAPEREPVWPDEDTCGCINMSLPGETSA